MYHICTLGRICFGMFLTFTHLNKYQFVDFNAKRCLKIYFIKSDKCVCIFLQIWSRGAYKIECNLLTSDFSQPAKGQRSDNYFLALRTLVLR